MWSLIQHAAYADADEWKSSFPRYFAAMVSRACSTHWLEDLMSDRAVTSSFFVVESWNRISPRRHYSALEEGRRGASCHTCSVTLLRYSWTAVRRSLTSQHHFYRAAAMHPRSCDEHLSVRPSVRPSVCLYFKSVNYNKTKKTSVHILIPYERSMHLVFRHEELLGDVPFYLTFWAKLTHLLQKPATFHQ